MDKKGTKNNEILCRGGASLKKYLKIMNKFRVLRRSKVLEQKNVISVRRLWIIGPDIPEMQKNKGKLRGNPRALILEIDGRN